MVSSRLSRKMTSRAAAISAKSGLRTSGSELVPNTNTFFLAGLGASPLWSPRSCGQPASAHADRASNSGSSRRGEGPRISASE